MPSDSIIRPLSCYPLRIGVGHRDGHMDTHSRSFAKALSWRITGTIDTMIISWLITGSIELAAAIGFTEVVTKSLLYYLHERAWLRIPYGRRSA